MKVCGHETSYCALANVSPQGLQELQAKLANLILGLKAPEPAAEEDVLPSQPNGTGAGAAGGNWGGATGAWTSPAASWGTTPAAAGWGSPAVRAGWGSPAGGPAAWGSPSGGNGGSTWGDTSGWKV